MRTAKYVAAAGALLALVLVSRWALQPPVDPQRAPGRATETPRADAPAPDAPSADAASAVLTCRYTSGETLAYGFETRDAIAAVPGGLLGDRAQGDDAQQADLRTDGRLDLFVMTVTPAGEAIAMGRVTDYRVQPPAADDHDAWGRHVDRAFLLRLGRHCDVTDVARHRDTDVLSHLRVTSVVDGLRFRVPAAAGLPPQLVALRDSLGTARVRVTHRPGSGRGALELEALGYPRGGAQGMTPRLLSGSGRVELGRATWFARLDVRQHVELLNQGKRAFDTRAQREYAETVPREGVFEGQPMNLSEYIWGPVPDDVLAQAHRNGRFAWLRGVPHDAAWEHYVELRDGGTPGAFFEAQALMRAWMAMNPEGVRALAQAMRDGAFDESAQSQLVLAMAKSGSPVAAAALQAMALDGALGENLRLQATSALADLRAPTGDTVDALTRLASRGEGVSEHDLVGSTATMALGSLMRDHPGYAPVAEPARAYLEQVLSEEDPVRVAEGLYAVGNAADEGFLPQIHALAGHAEENVRAAAVHATRRMSRDATTGLLGDLLREEPAPVVVEEIAMAHQEQLALTKGRLKGREISLYRTKLPSAPLKTRIEIVRTLGAVAAIQPEAVGVLAWWFHHETEAQVREMIGRFVPVDQLAVR